MTIPVKRPEGHKKYRSGTVIAKLLSTEGFTEHLANRLDNSGSKVARIFF